jgi:pectin methylesterase-like acyl-CoA thioesterase
VRKLRSVTAGSCLYIGLVSVKQRATAATTMRLAAFATALQVCTAISTIDRRACQHPSTNPLEGCPNNTLLVGPDEKYATVQSAILSLPNNTVPHHILVLPGNYTEQVNVTRPGPVYLFGQTKSPNDQSMNSVNIIWRNATGAEVNSTLDNAYTSTLTVAPTFNSSKTGTGPTGMWNASCIHPHF